jgi:hypothetical protein
MRQWGSAQLEALGSLLQKVRPQAVTPHRVRESTGIIVPFISPEQ